MKDLERRIVQISYDHKLSHLGSCLSAVGIIDNIYARKKPDEPFILSSGHAALALYTVIEKYEGINAESIFNHHGVHPDRCNRCHIYCSTGSLGQGLPIAVGMALSNRDRNVYCLISDGECAEGSIWEALRVRSEQNLKNLKVHVNVNGWAAYRELDKASLVKSLTKGNGYDICLRPPVIHLTSVEQFPFLKGQDSHYVVMSENQYEEAMELLK